MLATSPSTVGSDVNNIMPTNHSSLRDHNVQELPQQAHDPSQDNAFIPLAPTTHALIARPEDWWSEGQFVGVDMPPIKTDHGDNKSAINQVRHDYEPMSPKVCTMLYHHIVRVWLNADANSPINLALQSDNRTNLRELQYLQRRPGLILRLTYGDSNDGNVEKELTAEEYDGIFALDSFINNLQNNYGPIEDGMFDITTVSHYQFECFVARSFDIQQPIAYDEEKAIASRKRRLEVLQQYSLEDDTNPIAMKEIDAPPPDDSYPTWEEINWEDYPYEEESGRFASGYHYARYVLSQPRVPIRLQQSMTAIYGSIDTEQMI